MSEYLESKSALPQSDDINITRESWFIIPGLNTNPLRRVLYKAEDGSVVAYQNSTDNMLHVEHTFFDLYRHEPELEAIKADAGVHTEFKIELFNLH